MRPTYGKLDTTKGRFHITYRRRTYRVHRLVCEAFHGPAPDGKPNVLHRDEDGRNNKPINLKWGTQKENLNAPGFIAHCKSRTGAANPHRKSIMRRHQQFLPR